MSASGNPEADADLAHKAVRNPDAFSELYKRHLTGIYRYHLARTGNVQEAEDLTAHTFLTALESIDTYRGQGTFRAWLFGIASHKIADHFRRSREELPLEQAEEFPSPLLQPEEAVLLQLDLERVSTVLCLISPERAEALVLCLFGDLTLAEAARVMGKSEAAVKMLVHRGLCDLQTRLAAHMEVI